MDYTTLTLSEAGATLLDVAQDAEATFAGLDEHQLNWRPDATRWSVGQCFQHLLTANRLMLRAAEEALRDPTATIWRHIPMIPRAMGRALIRSQSPTTTRKFNAPAKARPTASEIPGNIIQRFIEQQRDAAAWMRTLVEAAAASAIMGSPFIRVVRYSVLDGCRLMVAHDRRHFEQARRVMLAREFPRVGASRIGTR
jgi:hypothetical protein